MCGGGGGVDSGRSSSRMLGIGVQAGSHRGRCSGVLVLVAQLFTLVCCPGDKRSRVLVQVAVVPLGVLAGDGILGLGVMAGRHGGRCYSARVPVAGILVAPTPHRERYLHPRFQTFILYCPARSAPRHVQHRI